jgi:hypothetical protein
MVITCRSVGANFLGLRLPLDLGDDLSDQAAHFVTIEFSNVHDSVDVLHEVL